MPRPPILRATLAAAAALLSTPFARADEVRRFVVFYGADAPADAFDPYDLAVLNAERHPPLQPLKDRGKHVFGYLSAGEVGSFEPHFEAVKAEGILLEENANWKGSFMVDVRDPRWTARVVEELAPRVLRKGFDGLFLDTLDNPPHLERTDPERFKGMSAAAVRLVKALRLHYPKVPLFVNRGYDLLPEIAGSIDLVLGESVYATYDWGEKKYRKVSENDYKLQLGFLRAARERNPKLRVLTLDYWDPADAAGVAAIYAEQRRNGFVPYVATIALDRVVPEPAAAP